ncbi:RHS repeat-associated core domain-containing protein, partial [Streptomyces sp. NPDC085460]|uniref:RHS repeat-associated core domain-containing protein n=1 Tax=Streptomyces sp. NPDC085460 TaxID=3365723 RepID=UPI0037D2B265
STQPRPRRIGHTRHGEPLRPATPRSLTGQPLGKPQDEETDLTHIGAREYDPVIGRFISVDPILAPDTHESVNGYTYSRNAPTTFSDPTGLKEIITEAGGPSDSAYLSKNKASWSGGPGNWTYTQHNDKKITFKDGSSVTLRTTVTIGKTIKVEHFTKGPDPIPIRKEAAPFTGYAMGSNPNYNPRVSLGIDRGPLATWQKVLLGGAVAIAIGVAVAPVAAVAGPACLAAWVVCAEGIAEAASGPAAGSGAAVGSAVGAVAATRAGRGEVIEETVVNLPEVVAAKPLKASQAYDAWTDFLGPGPYTNIHPRTGKVDPNRLVSADGRRSIRMGDHEMNSKPTKFHFHMETWDWDSETNTWTVGNTMQRVPLGAKQ